MGRVREERVCVGGLPCMNMFVFVLKLGGDNSNLAIGYDTMIVHVPKHFVPTLCFVFGVRVQDSSQTPGKCGARRSHRSPNLP